MYRTTDEFYALNRPATIYVGVAAFAVWTAALILFAVI